MLTFVFGTDFCTKSSSSRIWKLQSSDNLVFGGCSRPHLFCCHGITIDVVFVELLDPSLGLPREAKGAAELLKAAPTRPTGRGRGFELYSSSGHAVHVVLESDSVELLPPAHRLLQIKVLT